MRFLSDFIYDKEVLFSVGRWSLTVGGEKSYPYRVAGNRFIGMITLILLIAACTETRYVQAPESDDQTTYRGLTSQGWVAEQIEESFRSVVRIQSTVFYRTYLFSPEEMPVETQLPFISLEERAEEIRSDNHSSAGTAIAVSRASGRTALVTTSHIVSYPDTILHHVHEGATGEAGLLEGVSVKERVNYLLFREGGVDSFELVIDEPNRDLSLLVAETSGSSRDRVRPLPFRPGNPDDLNWADLVYAVGFPRGVQMVTSGLVSQSSLRRWDGFTVDASFNRGFSGGALFAVRNDGAGLDWVGLITSTSADREYVLTPGEFSQEDYMPNVPYRDSIYVERRTRINYGVSHATGMGEIRRFLEEHRTEIEGRGFSLPDFR